jgi:hypothetical protein
MTPALFESPESSNVRVTCSIHNNFLSRGRTGTTSTEKSRENEKLMTPGLFESFHGAAAREAVADCRPSTLHVVVVVAQQRPGAPSPSDRSGFIPRGSAASPFQKGREKRTAWGSAALPGPRPCLKVAFRSADLVRTHARLFVLPISSFFSSSAAAKQGAMRSGPRGASSLPLVSGSVLGGGDLAARRRSYPRFPAR